MDCPERYSPPTRIGQWRSAVACVPGWSTSTAAVSTLWHRSVATSRVAMAASWEPTAWRSISRSSPCNCELTTWLHERRPLNVTRPVATSTPSRSPRHHLEGAAMIDLTWEGRVALITLNRPEKRNALSIELCHRLGEAVRSAVAGGTRAIVITGNGTSFCAGADLRVAAPTAVFAIPTAKIGLAVDPWTIRRFALLAGTGTARAVLLACDQLDAEQAHSCGFVARVGTVDDAIAWAQDLAELAPLTVGYSKQVLNSLFEPELDPAASKELFKAFDGCWASEDLAEGARARAEKRPPRFEGR